MFEFQPLPYDDKAKFYTLLKSEIDAMLEPTWFSNLANVSSALMAHVPNLNWAGFYLTVGEELVLGPFQGLPACLRIPFGKGVCGTAAAQKKSQLVHDVHAFPGHIACDARSRAEVVVPLIKDGRVIGVLDLDSPKGARFDEADVKGLEQIVSSLIERTIWPTEFV